MTAVTTVKLAGTLPTGQHNGLLPLHARLVDGAKNDVLVAVALIDRRKLEHDDDSHMDVPTMRIRRIEIMSDKNDSGDLIRLMLREFERRTGQTVLPLDLEHDLREVVDAGVEASPPEEGGGEQDGMFSGGEPDE
jgi:hypothetical protein